MKKALLKLAALAAIAASTLFAQDITGTWQGTLTIPNAKRDLRTVIKIAKADSDKYKATFYSIDQGGQPLGGSATLQGSTVKMALPGLGASYEGKLDTDGVNMTGTFTQGGQLPLNLKKVNANEAWEIPAPPPVLKPMAKDANPSFEVATIKPGDPSRQGRGFGVRGREFSTLNTTLNSLIVFAYGVHPRQIVNGQPWMDEDKFDILAKPDGEGQPSDAQWKLMLQKMLTDRFQLKFHHEKKELSVYALVAAKTGPKLTKSEGDPNGLPGLFFRGLGNLPARNANMGDLAGLLQSAVLDRPVVDQTDIKGRYDFELKWTPDENQFQSLGMKVQPPAGADSLPDLFTAMQEQLGLKLTSTKADVDVLAIDHVAKPSGN
jgi:uncharacterized protein (TIGR03435 family)